jgi:hypothetical protein
MFHRHVGDRLSAYCENQVSAGEAARVRDHLSRCEPCRKELEQVQFGLSLVGALPRVQAPRRLWEELRRELPARQPARRWTLMPALAASLAVVIAAVALARARLPGAAWEVTPVAGTPTVGRARVDGAARLRTGEWLETDGASRARIRFGEVGQVAVEPNTRVRLVAARRDEHRLALERGTIEASIWAPPRLFFVDTASARAIDLGCAYTMHAEPDGRGLLRVTSGWVMLEQQDLDAIVPAGAACRTYPRLGPGTPYFEDASSRLIDAVAAFDSGRGREEALQVVLDEARESDTLTLWHLFRRVAQEARSVVLDRAAALAPLPREISRERLLALDRAALEDWRSELEAYW